MGALDGIVEAYTGERGFMGTHRYKVFGLLEVAGKTGRAETNGMSGAPDAGRPWEATHKAFSDAMKERLEPHRGNVKVEPHQMRGTFAECRYKSRILGRSFVDTDPERSIARVTLDIQETGITFQPGDRLAIMPVNSWVECAKVAAALGLDEMLEHHVDLDTAWTRFSEHLGSVSRTASPRLTVKDLLRRGHLAPLTKNLVMRLHAMLRASSNTVLQVLATNEWPVRATLGDILQAAVMDTPSHIWDQAFNITGSLKWLPDLVPIECPRTYSISNCLDELLLSTVDLTVSRSEYPLHPALSDALVPTRNGVSSGFLNPAVSGQDEFIADDEELLVGISRPLAFQLPIDDAAPCAYFAGGSGIAPFRSFWQARAGRSVGKNMLFLGVQSREKFCYGDELREYMDVGFMEVYTAFSRDTRGLVYDRYSKALVEKEISPRYIDTAIIEQGSTVCDMVMSKKQGGLGGYLYVCGSLSVFDSVMSGIRRAIYNHRTASMESTDVILDTAFAERRFMIDVFMSPKPLPCNTPTIPLSRLAMHTGHEKGSRIFIAVHGSVYDVTDFCPMHPGGTNIIKSNAGVDCSKSFDLLAHTNNPEVSSLLNKYFIGHLAQKPDFHLAEEISMLYDLWSDYLRASVETLVSQAFEVHEFMESSSLWFQGSLFNMGGVRRFYHHQSRLLQSGFSALFGPKLQELYLKLSFTLANTSTNSSPSRLPDVLGIIARSKGSPDAIKTSNEVSEIGQFTCNSETARFHEQGILGYARKSVQLDMELLEGIREEACRGMDSFDAIMNLDATSDSQRITALSTFLLQVCERMAIRLESFYSKLAQHSVYHPGMEQNPARTRWNLLRRKIQNGSFFVLTQDIAMTTSIPYASHRNQYTVEFDHVINQIQQNIIRSPSIQHRLFDLTDQHVARGEASTGVSAYESYENGHAIKHISAFMNNNIRAIRRISKLPSTGVSLEQLMTAYAPKSQQRQLPTPPTSRSSSRSSKDSVDLGQGQGNKTQLEGLNVHGRTMDPLLQGLQHRSTGSYDGNMYLNNRLPSPPRSPPSTQGLPRSTSLPIAPLSAAEALPAMLKNMKMNRRQTAGAVPLSPAASLSGRGPMMRGIQSMRTSMASNGNLQKGLEYSSAKSMTGSLRALKLQEVRAQPTF
jgi:sulfite reductase alpha subunit-like flavoprotein/cytochrome b involved in lipid metabolism